MDGSVTATVDSGKIILVGNEGRDVKVGVSDLAVEADAGTDTASGGGITLTAQKATGFDADGNTTFATDGTAVVLDGTNAGTPPVDKTAGTVTAVKTDEVKGDFSFDFSTAKLDSSIVGDVKIGNTVLTQKEGTTTESVASLDLSTAEGAQNAIDVLDAAMEQVDDKRAEIGAFQNRMNHTMSNLANINENVNASNSRIKDVDFASETINMTKGQILQQAGTSILAQAKQIPQAALSLLG
nr:flagellin [Photobacterium leiognathi]